MNITDYIDLENGLARTRGNKALYCRLLGMLLNSKEFASFEAFLAENNFEQAGNVAHAIKGMTGNLALTPLFKISETLMIQLRQGIVDQANLACYRETLTNTLDAVKAYINS